MGNSFRPMVSRIFPMASLPRSEQFIIDDDTNGYLLNGVMTNLDILVNILQYVPDRDLIFACRLVCKSWCTLIDQMVWHSKLRETPYKNDHYLIELPWYILFWIVSKQPLKRNLLINNSGHEGVNKGWEIKSNGGNKWAVEKPPLGCDPFPYELDEEKALPVEEACCFVTSFHSCSKQQVIDLYKVGAVAQIMDYLEPEISVSEWFAGRWDCSAIYELEVQLIKTGGDILKEFQFRKNVGGAHGAEWHKISHTFKGYGKGVRYVRFYHGGVDQQFWAGHYGSKMAGACVKIQLTSDLIDEKTSQL